jgi:hypothetical protein
MVSMGAGAATMACGRRLSISKCRAVWTMPSSSAVKGVPVLSINWCA